MRGLPVPDGAERQAEEDACPRGLRVVRRLDEGSRVRAGIWLGFMGYGWMKGLWVSTDYAAIMIKIVSFS